MVSESEFEFTPPVERTTQSLYQGRNFPSGRGSGSKPGKISTLANATLTAFLLALALPLRAQPPVEGSRPWTVVLNPENSFQFFVLNGNKPVVKAVIGGWGPDWSWASPPQSKQKAGDGILRLEAPFKIDESAGQIMDVTAQAIQTATNTLTWTYTLSAKKDLTLGMLKLGLNALNGVTGRITLSGTTTRSFPMPVRRSAALDGVQKISMEMEGAGKLVAEFDPAVRVASENNDLRVQLAHDTFSAGEKTIKMTLTFPAALSFAATDAQMGKYIVRVGGPDWFAWTAKNPSAPSEIGFENWLDKPAGRHGGVRMVGDHFEFTDGTQVKFWGTDLSYAANAPQHGVAVATAKRFAKYGVNAVRMHKWTGSGWEGIGDPDDATKMDPNGLERVDYFCSQLARNGVYYGWSHTYHFHVEPGNRSQLLDYDELASHDHGDTYGLINFAPDIQKLLIQRVVNLLKHENLYTHTNYANDPALAFLELQNEDDIFFYTSEPAYNSHPLYARDLRRRFSQWLDQKYGGEDGLKKAWAGAVKSDEAISQGNITLQMNPWFFSSDHLPQTRGGERQRLLDNALFLHQQQHDFYQRFVKAIREAGYQGPICGSPWQAPAMLPHYYNLLSDYQAGWIDRHNYFEGGINGTMLAAPGSGYLSSGLQQVADRPFGLSEWIHVYPDLYSAEGPLLMAVYGMGLQGWDASFEFQSQAGGGWDDRVGWFAYGVWEADVPTQLGQYPLQARMIQRGDVKEAGVISTRYICVPKLEQGEFNFADTVLQNGDIKSFGGTVPAEALAAGRCVVAFADTPQDSTFPEMARYYDGNLLKSATGQLAWDTSPNPEVTVNTEGTKAIVGFARDVPQRLGDVTITTHVPYAAIIVTARDRNATLATGNTALISAIARNVNTGFEYFRVNNSIVNNGTAPILLESVKATITFARPVAEFRVLDQDGAISGRVLPANGGTVEINTGRDQTMYYEVVFR